MRAAAYSRITHRLEWRICALCQLMTQKAAAEIVKMLPSPLSDLLHWIVTRVHHGHEIRGLATLGEGGRPNLLLQGPRDPRCFFIKRWMAAALRSRIPTLRQIIGTLRNQFDNMIYLTVGDLDIPARIPSHLRML